MNSILEDYANYEQYQENTHNEYAVNEAVVRIKDCFNLMLGTQPLYKFE